MRALLNIALFALAGIVSAQDFYEVVPVKIDDRFDHFMPVICGDHIVFSSTNSEDDVIKYTVKGKDKAPSGLFQATIQEGKLVGVVEPLAKNLNTSLHEGPATFTADGMTMIFTRNLYTDIWIGNDRKAKNKLGLFISTKHENEWSEPIPFKYNSEEFNVGHPTLSKDGNTLYFASNMPGGFGGIDLYRSELHNGEWSRPKNLGKKINTGSNEMFPTLVNDQMIYFSSDREHGSGGLDIYVSSNINGGWSTPSALPAPLNSSTDDMGFAPLSDRRTGYLSSNRNGKDEIFYFKRTIPLFKDCQPQVESNFCYVFEEEGTLGNDSLPLIYQWDLGDGTTRNGTEVEHCFAGPGTYTVKLNIVDTISKSIFFNEASYELIIEDKIQPYISMEGPLNSRELLSFSAERSTLMNKRVAEYHWDLGDSSDVLGMDVEKRFKRAGEKVIRLDVIFEPDSTGSLTHQCVTRNIELLEPKEAVEISDATVQVEYKDSEGVTHSFTYQELPYDLFDMSVKEGEDVFFTVELLASKERVSTSDPFFDKAREKFQILENYISDKDQFSYSVGKERSLASTFPIYQELQTMEYTMAEVKAVNIEKVKEIGDPEDMAALELLNIEDLNNTVLRMSTIYFTSGDYSIDTTSVDALDKLMKIVSAFDKIDLEISAHTDNTGPSAFNKILSEKRAESIVEHLIERGLARDRMKAIGYGEDHPIAANDTEEGKQLNRRVEFKLVANTLLSSEQ